MIEGYDYGMEAALSHIGPAVLELDSYRGRALDQPDVEGYIRHLMYIYGRNSLIMPIENAGLVAENRNRDLFDADRARLSNAIHKGVVIGLRVMDLFLPPSLNIYRLQPGKATGSEQASRVTEQDFTRLGDEGYAAAKSYHKLLEKWQPKLVRYSECEQAFHRAFGLVIYLMNGVWNAHNLEVEQAMADLDEELKMLFEGPQTEK